MTIKSVTVKNGTTGPDYDVLGDEITKSGATGIAQLNVLLARRRDSMSVLDDPTGNLADISVDHNGRLQSTPNALMESVTSTIVATAGTVVITTEGAAVVYAYFSGTYAGLTVAYETSADDGVTWWAVNGHYVLDGAVNTTQAIPTNGVSLCIIPTAGADRVRVRATAFTSGTANVRLRAMAIAATHTNSGVGGQVATDLPVLGNPIYNGARANNIQPVAMSADGDMVPMWADRNGAVVSVVHERMIRISATPAITLTPYTAGDQVGGVMTFTNATLALGRSGYVRNVLIVDKSKVKAPFTMWLFTLTPTLVSTDNAPFDMLDASLDTALLIGHVDFLTADYRDTASGSACTGRFVGGDIEMPFVTTTTANIFGVLVTSGTPTFTSVSDLVVNFYSRQM